MNVRGTTGTSKLKLSTVVTGSAGQGKIGLPLGVVDIGVSESAYLFRVALPGVRKDQCKLKCGIEYEGKVNLEGVITDSGILDRSPSAYEMKVQQLCPPGPFTVSFNLPGPVDPRLFAPNFRSDGILEGVVMKQKMHGVQIDG